MSSPVVTVTPESKVSEAVALLKHHKISSIVVVDRQLPVGIFTERSLLRLAISGSFNPNQVISKIITTKPITSHSDISINEAYLLFLQHNIRHLIIVDNQGLLIGIATETDLLHNLGLEYFVSFDDIGDVITQDVITLAQHDSLYDAMQLMNNNNISSIVIAKNSKPAGIITERDIVRLIEAETDLYTTPLSEVMSRPVQTALSDISVHSAALLIKKIGIRRLVITDNNNQIAGILTETDIVKGLQSEYINLLKEVIETQVVQLQQVRKQLDDKIILESMMHSTTDMAFVITDLDYKILHSNKTAETLLGYTSKEAKKVGIPTIIEREGLGAGHLDEVAGYIKNKGKVNYTYTRKIGSASHHIESNVFGIKNQDDDIQGYVLIARDISDSVETRQHLQKRSEELEETNAALRVLLKQREIDKEEINLIFQQNVDQLVLPFFSKLHKSNSCPNHKKLLKSVENNLRQISSPFAHRISNLFAKLTPAEMQVANLIKNGHSSKEIATLLNLSDKTIYTHRRNIRQKSGITNQKVNLQTILQQLETTML
ncbi:CBS domain-containing protein [Desulfosediminicola flagellatus]|uniref:CBS domain-containing protein n=1 Tax=Desulfosediminicola flagellatus TaxID=2569541 RepID=UPI001E2F6F7E|nr:CBS domain-containing protein [Desulfosediminicola flagellatus]